MTRELGRHAPLTTDRLLPHSVHVDGLRLDNEVKPVFPDAALLASGTRGPEDELLVEYDRTGRPAKNLEKFRRYDTLLTIGWRAIERFRRLRADNDLRPPLSVVVVCQEGSVESFMRAADAEVAGALRFYMRPGEVAYPGRNRLLFCDADDVRAGRPRAWLLPELPHDQYRGPFEPREGRLPFCAHAPTDQNQVLDWAF